jgi:hypothetical protein
LLHGEKKALVCPTLVLTTSKKRGIFLCLYIKVHIHKIKLGRWRQYLKEECDIIPHKFSHMFLFHVFGHLLNSNTPVIFVLKVFDVLPLCCEVNEVQFFWSGLHY